VDGLIRWTGSDSSKDTKEDKTTNTTPQHIAGVFVFKKTVEDIREAELHRVWIKEQLIDLLVVMRIGKEEVKKGVNRPRLNPCLYLNVGYSRKRYIVRH